MKSCLIVQRRFVCDISLWPKEALVGDDVPISVIIMFYAFLHDYFPTSIKLVIFFIYLEIMKPHGFIFQ